MTKLPTIFLSYCGVNQAEAEQIYADLKAVGITVIKDSHEMAYLDSVGKFMQSIRDADFALLLLSEHYLKSRSCMYEVSQLFQEREAAQKLLPVLVDGTKLYGTRERISYIQYWQDEQKALKKALKKLDPVNAAGLYEDLRTITEIASRMDSMLTTFADLKTITLSKLRARLYQPLLVAAGFNDLSYLFQLLTIFTLKTVEDKELALDEYLTQFPANAFYYGVKAGVCRDAGRIKQACFNYEKALELHPQHTEALNNLGELYRIHLNDPAKACQYYEQAIAVDPSLTVARLNLGYVRNRDLQDPEGAKAQYEQILAYEPTSAKAHLNLANILNQEAILTQGLADTNLERVRFHYRQVIKLRPDDPVGYVAYGNFLKLRGHLEEGNAQYQRAKRLDKRGQFAEMLAVLLQSKKG